MRACVVTIFPELVRAFLAHGLIKRATEVGTLAAEVADLRDYTHDRHRTVDDTPFGGGAGMVMKPEPIFEAVEAVRRPGDLTVLLSPSGEPLTHALARELAAAPGLVLLCGRYEGVDDRVGAVVDREVSIGDYVLMGGELPAMVLLEAVARHLPGVLGNASSATDESFTAGLLEAPHYTRPAEFRGLKVPDVLLSGDHAAVDRWRRHEALKRTLARRPDLLPRAPLSDDDRAALAAQQLRGGGVGPGNLSKEDHPCDSQVRPRI